MKKYFKQKGIWGFWLVVVVAAVAIYAVAWQAGLTIESVNSAGSSSVVVSVKKPAAAKTPTVVKTPAARY